MKYFAFFDLSKGNFSHSLDDDNPLIISLYYYYYFPLIPSSSFFIEVHTLDFCMNCKFAYQWQMHSLKLSLSLSLFFLIPYYIYEIESKKGRERLIKYLQGIFITLPEFIRTFVLFYARFLCFMLRIRHFLRKVNKKYFSSPFEMIINSDEMTESSGIRSF